MDLRKSRADMAVRMRKVMAIPRKLNRGNRGVNHGVDTFASVLILVLYLPIIQGSFPKYTQAYLSTEIFRLNNFTTVWLKSNTKFSVILI